MGEHFHHALFRRPARRGRPELAATRAPVWAVFRGLLSVVQVVKGGRHIKLTFRNRKEYIAAAVKTRAQECRVQVEAVLEGLSAIVPLPLLKLFSAAELKVLCPADFNRRRDLPGRRPLAVFAAACVWRGDV